VANSSSTSLRWRRLAPVRKQSCVIHRAVHEAELVEDRGEQEGPSPAEDEEKDRSLFLLAAQQAARGSRKRRACSAATAAQESLSEGDDGSSQSALSSTKRHSATSGARTLSLVRQGSIIVRIDSSVEREVWFQGRKKKNDELIGSAG
jgi:hypothetical protein